MKKSLFVVPFFVLLGACNSGSSGNNGGGNNNSPQDNSGVEEQGQGSFVDDLEQPTSEALQKERYSLGCQEPGSHEANPQMDSRLKVGQSETTLMRAFTRSFKTRFVIKGTISQVERKGKGGSVAMSINLVEAQGIDGLNAGMTGTESCTFSEDGAKKDCKTEMPPLLVNAQNYSNRENCHLKNITSAKGNTHSRGTYILRSGKKITAFREAGAYSGVVECDGKERGEGSLEVVSVRTNEAISLSNEYCGGENVRSYYKLKLKSGETLAAFDTEILDANY